jgi:protein-S-isoprenylcysteine O-methyltransferase Ste14
MVLFHGELFKSSWPSTAAFVAGLVLIVFEAWMFWRVYGDLGAARLVGKTELSGAGKIECSGIYSRIRHPRYTASFLAILGACLLAGRWAMWIAAATWLLLMAVVIGLEEREMRIRFGAAYLEYARKVRRILPLRTTQRG